MITQTQTYVDPKTQLLQFIVEQDKLLTYFMRDHQEAEASHVIALLIRQIDINLDKELSPAMQKLKEAITLNNYDLATEQTINDGYELIHMYLLRTYYKGWVSATPKENRPQGKL
jgi:hypothetical protein